MKTETEKNEVLKRQLATADAIIIGAGSGLSTAAGYVYTGERFRKYFGDFEKKYGFHDMYSGGFYPYDSLEEFWGFWCRYIWINRYAPIPSDLYRRLFNLVKDKDYFVLTTNVDHCFQRSEFDKSRLFYTQGDYGLFQSSAPSGKSAGETYDNFEIVKEMVLSEGFEIDENGELVVPEYVAVEKNRHAELVSASVKEITNLSAGDNDCPRVRNDRKIKMSIPSELVPYCPDDGKPMTTNLRSDDLFVEDSGWHKASRKYSDFLEEHKDAHILYLELGVGMNTPGIIKYPFWRLTMENKNAFYACINKGESYAPREIAERSICIDEGIKEMLDSIE